MQVLVTESIASAGRTATEELEASGHRVRRCRDDSSAPFPCAGLVAECPLDAGTIDLVLAVRPQVQVNPGDDEFGITCALRRQIPIAIAGQPLMNPFEPFGAEPVVGDLVGECERIAASRRPGHEHAAAETMRAALASGGYPPEASDLSVRRVAGRLRVRVFVPGAVTDAVRKIIAVRVVGCLREFDAYTAGIDIGVGSLPDDREEPR